MIKDSKSDEIDKLKQELLGKKETLQSVADFLDDRYSDELLYKGGETYLKLTSEDKKEVDEVIDGYKNHKESIGRVISLIERLSGGGSSGGGSGDDEERSVNSIIDMNNNLNNDEEIEKNSQENPKEVNDDQEKLISAIQTAPKGSN